MKMLIVNCTTCDVRGDACADCVISTLLGTPDADVPPSLSGEEQRVLGLFAESGMLPPLRLVEARSSPFDVAGDEPQSFGPIGHRRSG
jgi:hypothetical protein